MDLLDLGKETARLGGLLQITRPLADGGTAAAEWIDKIGPAGTGDDDHRLALHVIDQRPGRFERRHLRRDELVDAQFIVLTAAGADAHGPVIAEDQAGTVTLPPLPEHPGVFEPTFLFADLFDVFSFTVGERASVGVTGKDFLPHLLQLGLGEATQ